jgi:hypothetical protein
MVARSSGTQEPYAGRTPGAQKGSVHDSVAVEPAPRTARWRVVRAGRSIPTCTAAGGSLAVLCLSLLVVGIDGTIVVVAL